MAKTRVDLFTERRATEMELEEKHRAAKKSLMQSEYVTVSIPSIYRSRLGSNLPISVGLETITIPVDGKSYKVKKPFAAALKKHLYQIDKEEARSRQQHGSLGTGDVSPTGPIPGKV